MQSPDGTEKKLSSFRLIENKDILDRNQFNITRVSNRFLLLHIIAFAGSKQKVYITKYNCNLKRS